MAEGSATNHKLYNTDSLSGPLVNSLFDSEFIRFKRISCRLGAFEGFTAMLSDASPLRRFPLAE